MAALTCLHGLLCLDDSEKQEFQTQQQQLFVGPSKGQEGTYIGSVENV